MSKKSSKKLPSVWRFNFAYVGVLTAALFFALSLTPSLLPRGLFFQSFVSGVTAVIGYGLGVGVQKLWLYLQLPTPNKDRQKLLDKIFQVLVGFVLLIFLWKFVGWQNDVRLATGSNETLSPVILIPIFLLSSLIAYLVLVLSRSIGKLFITIIRWFQKILPERTAKVFGATAALVVLMFLINGVLVNGFFALANQTFSVTDASNDEGITQPEAPEKSGSPASQSPWDTLGRQGRKFVSTGPTKEDLTQYSGVDAQEPVRVYVGLKTSNTLEGRANLALEELKRTGGFDREVLVIATTTGTGWLDPKAVDPLEYIYNGDSAIVGVQYSYLPSWISMFADQGKAKDASIVVFDTIHEYWQTLPENARPEIYVYGLSLGSFGAESIIQSVNILNSPINGAVFSGPTLYNNLRNAFTDNRDDNSPAWRPVIDNGRTVRFTGQENVLNEPTATWGDTKLAYTQHATDPVSFFSFDLALREPDWLKDGQRGPDITDNMRWIPFVTMWQVAGDLPTAGAVKDGHGHNYSRQTMIDTWLAVTEPESWSETQTSKLKDFFANN